MATASVPDKNTLEKKEQAAEPDNGEPPPEKGGAPEEEYWDFKCGNTKDPQSCPYKGKKKIPIACSFYGGQHLSCNECEGYNRREHRFCETCVQHTVCRVKHCRGEWKNKKKKPKEYSYQRGKSIEEMLKVPPKKPKKTQQSS